MRMPAEGISMEATDFKYPAGDVKTAGFSQALLLLMKPGIVAAVLLAGLAGMAMAARSLPGARNASLCLLILFLAAAGSAMLNNIFDAPLDRRMPRLEERVGALARIGATRLLLTAVACIAASLLLALVGLNPLTFLLVLAAVLSYTVFYTLHLKRRSPWGAILGGIPGALPVLIGQAAATGAIDSGGMLLFSVIFLWQPPHFWLLALRHQDDYRNAGIPVLPVARGEEYTRVLILLYVTALLPAGLALSAAGRCSGVFEVVAGALWLYFLAACWRHAMQARRFELAFRASIIYLALLLAAVTFDSFLAKGSFSSAQPAVKPAATQTARSGPSSSSFTCSARGTAQRVCAPGL
jgi:protoheme IX farnesyltransferase